MERFVICRASAGSGKTYTLVRQFIEASISSPNDVGRRFERVLAITFTNKAANGMKQRIMRQLRDIVCDSPSARGMLEEMSADLDITVAEVVSRCTVLQSSILHRYSNFSVCTIDSFVQRLVRTFAHDLHLPMNFNVQVEDQEVLRWSVDELLSTAGKEGEDSVTRVLCDFVESRMEDGTGYNLENKLMDLAQQILKEETPEYLSQLGSLPISDFMEAYRRLRDENRSFEQQLASAATPFVEACRQFGLGVNDFPNKKSGIFPFFERFAEGDMSKLNNEHKRVHEAASKGVLYAKTTPPELKEKIEAVTPAFIESYRLIESLLEQERSRYNTRNLLLPNLFGLALLGRINTFKDDYYRENETVHISEFNKRIADQIADEPAPFIYERIGSRYSNYMIDEFQDTSRLQWLNFLPLLDEALSRRPSADTAMSGLQSLVVGDGKQAIYRFRQGDVRQFMRLPEVDDPVHGASLIHYAKTVNLDRNFRTLSNIVEFNNRFFSHIVSHQFADNPELRDLYLGEGGVGHPDLLQRPVKTGGHVELSFMPKDDMCRHILGIIRHQVDNLGYRYSDIMVLARNNRTLVEISDYLIANSVDRPVPLVSAESFLLGNSRVVAILHSLLRSLYDPDDRVAAVDIVLSLCHIGIIELQGGENEALWQLKQCGFNLPLFLDGQGIRMNEHYLRSLSLYDCCEQLLRSFRLQGRDTAYVASFLNVVDTFQSRNHSGLRGLLDYLDVNIGRLSCSTASDMDAVQLITVHKAKGLESKIVICAMPSEKAHGAQLWVDIPREAGLPLPVAFVNIKKEPTLFDPCFDEERRLSDMDRINVLYVALTRAGEKLMMVCEDKFTAERKDNLSLLYDFAKQDEEFTSLTNRDFSIGDDLSNAVKASDEEYAVADDVVVGNAVFPSWNDRIGVAAQSGALLSSVLNDSRRYGIMVHEIMSLISHRGDAEDVIVDYCRQKGYDDEVTGTVLRRITGMMDSEANSRYFDPRHRAIREVPMVVDGMILRPDRVVFGDDVTWVVDFKTGLADDEKREKYNAQVAAYCNAIAAMGYPNVTPVIIEF